MKIVLFRSNNIFDSRVNKYHNYYERAGLDYTIVGWDRKGDGWQKDHYDFFQYRAGEAVGGEGFLFGIIEGLVAHCTSCIVIILVEAHAIGGPDEGKVLAHVGAGGEDARAESTDGGSSSSVVVRIV